MEVTEFQLNHPKTGAPCDCTVWVMSRHRSTEGANIVWRAEWRMADQPKMEIGLRSSDLLVGALLLPSEVLARALMEGALG